jgi:hypothetical protein
MSFAVIHMQKFKTGGIRGINNHNERLKESKTNPDINPEKSYLNESLHTEFPQRTYYNRVKDRIKELKLSKAVRKDAVTMCGFICTSDREYFDKLTQTEQKRFFIASYDFLKNRYGINNIVAATVHYDEKTPHMHCFIVPVTENGRLSAKSIFTRTELRNLQSDYPKYMNDKGFEIERGISSDGKRKHLDTQEFKIQTKQQEIEKNNKTLNSKFETVKDIIQNISHIENIEKKKSLLGNKVTLKADDYNMLVDMAKQGVYNSDDIRDLKKLNKSQAERILFNNRNFSDVFDRAEELEKKIINMKKGANNEKRLYDAMFKTLNKYDLLPEANENFKIIREAAIKARKSINKSNEYDYER